MLEIRDPESAADVDDLAVDLKSGEHLDCRLEDLDLEELAAQVTVQADEVGSLLDRLLDLAERDAELAVDLAGLDVGVCRRLDSGRDAHQRARAVGRHDPVEAVDLVERVDDDVADASGDRLLELGVGLVVAVHQDALGRESAR